MKKYRFCLLLFLAASLICMGTGYGLTEYQTYRQKKEQAKNQAESQAEAARMASIEAGENTLEAGENAVETMKETDAEVKPANLEAVNRYYLVCEDGFLLVFCRDKSTVCLYTHVPITDFPEEEQARLRSGIWFASMMDIFSYLESYTS